MLKGLTADMWSAQHEAQINQFIADPSQQLLLVYLDEQNGLTLCHSFPPFKVEEIAYFAREENAEIHRDNFAAVVQFGTVHGSYVDGLLRAMHNLYGPTFFENTDWPDSILKTRLPPPPPPSSF